MLIPSTAMADEGGCWCAGGGPVVAQCPDGRVEVTLQTADCVQHNSLFPGFPCAFSHSLPPCFLTGKEGNLIPCKQSLGTSNFLQFTHTHNTQPFPCPELRSAHCIWFTVLHTASLSFTLLCLQVPAWSPEEELRKDWRMAWNDRAHFEREKTDVKGAGMMSRRPETEHSGAP